MEICQPIQKTEDLYPKSSYWPSPAAGIDQTSDPHTAMELDFIPSSSHSAK